MFNKPRVILGLILIFIVQGCAGPHGPTLPSAQTGVPLKEICAKYNVDWQWDGVTQVVILEHNGNKAKALVGSNVILLGKEKISLSAPLRRVNSAIYVPEDFESKVIAPFGITPGQAIARGGRSGLRLRTVIIDPGHGGKDPGAQGHGGVKEKDVVLDISKRLKTLLEQVGIQVIMTRHKDIFLSLGERTEMASKTDADLFVSVHANSNPVRKTQGMEVYYVKTKEKRDLEEEQHQKNEKIFVRKLNMHYSPVRLGVVADMMYSHKIAESAKVAEIIVQESSNYVQTPNRGARACRFFVVRNTLIPAVLVEVGFLTNSHEEKKLNSPVYRQKIAEAMARSISNYASDP